MMLKKEPRCANCTHFVARGKYQYCKGRWGGERAHDEPAGHLAAKVSAGSSLYEITCPGYEPMRSNKASVSDLKEALRYQIEAQRQDLDKIKNVIRE